MCEDRYEEALIEAERVFLRRMVTFAAVLASIWAAAILTGCGLTGGDVWNAATNAVSGGGGGTATTTDTTTTTVPAVESAYKVTQVWADGIQWTGPNMPTSWPEQRAEEIRDPEEAAMIERAGGPTCGEVHLRSSKGRAKFDHLRRDTKVRDWKNIHGGYGAWRQWGEPAQGEACELWACNYAQTEWVKIGGFRWVR